MSEVLTPRRPALWRRQLPHHPDTGPRHLCPAIVVRHEQAVQREMQSLGMA